jgi:hypothetical protein
VLLFLDRLPIHRWYYNTPTGGQACQVSVSVPALPGDPDPACRPAEGLVPQRWVFDSGCTGEGFVWRRHLADAGLHPDRLHGPEATLRTANGTINVPVRKAVLWLVSNIPALQGCPYRLPLSPGIPFQNAAWPWADPPDLRSPILGLRPLLRGGLKVEIDARGERVSLWVPAPWLNGAWLWLRRVPTGFRTLPPPW